MRALFAILITILVIETTFQVSIRKLSQQIKKEMRQNRILGKNKNGVQETDEENVQVNTTKKVQIDSKVQNIDPNNSQLVDNEDELQPKSNPSTLSKDDYTQNELPDTEQDVKNYEERQKQLQEAMKNVTPKDENSNLNLMIFSLFFSILGIFI